jgi:hypothetical protein
LSQTHDHNQRLYSPPIRSVARGQRDKKDHHSPMPAQKLTVPAMPYKRLRGRYSPPPPRAQHYSPPHSPSGPPTRNPWSRKRPRPTPDRYAPDEPPAQRPWQDDPDRERIIYERQPSVEPRNEYGHMEDVPNGPQTPPRPAPWDHMTEPEPQLQFDSPNRPRSPSPTLKGGKTVRIGNGESYRPGYDSRMQQYGAPPTQHQIWERPDVAHVSATYESNPVSFLVPGALSSRIGISNTIDPTHRLPSAQQASPNLTLLDRMSDFQRLPPSGPSSQPQSKAYFQSQKNGNIKHNRRPPDQPRGGAQRGQPRSRPARGRGGGQGASTEYSVSERQSLAARISGISTLQERLS